MAGREPTFMAAIGITGGGKTFQNIQQIKRVLQGRPGGAKPKKVLIFDSNDEYRNDNEDVRRAGIYIKPIHISQVARFSASSFVEACSIRPLHDNGSPMDLNDLSNGLTKVMKDFRDGLLVAEDFKSFAGDSIKADLVSKLCTRRHSGSDTLVSLQDISLVAPKVWLNLKWLRMHMLGDLIIKFKDRFPGKVEFLSIAENIVRSRFFGGDERIYVMINVIKGHIFGAYSQLEFNDAARQYISDNWAGTVGRELNRRDANWNRIHKDEKIAAGIVLKRLADQYSQYSSRVGKQ